jgi:aminodeoxychorismate lyase
MIVFLNGRFVPEAQATVSVFDRSFLYGDGLFETMRVANGKPFRWEQHLDRLARGAEFLDIKIPFDHPALAQFAGELIARNHLPEALLRLTLSRGVGPRGYSPRGADQPSLVMTLHPFKAPAVNPEPSMGAPVQTGGLVRWRAHTADCRLPAGEALAQFKTCNKLAQVLARAEAEAADADEALLLNTAGFLVEGASSNFFWIQEGTVCTPPLASGVLAGVTRAVVRELCETLGQPFKEAQLTPAELPQVDGAFLSLSSLGLVELAEVDGTPLNRAPILPHLHAAYQTLLREECGAR